MSRFLATLTASILALSPLMAQEVITLHEGDNIMPHYSSVTATFTPENDCKVLIEAEDQYKVQYDGQTYAFTYVSTNYPACVCEIDKVKAGATITLQNDFVMMPLVRITTMPIGTAVPVELNASIPAQGSSDFWNENGLLSLTFNRNVTLSGATLSVGQAQHDIEILHVSSAITLNVGPTLNQLLADGTLQPGAAFIVTVTGLCDAADPTNLYKGTGKLSLRFRAPQPQYGLVSTTVAGQTLSLTGLNDYTFLSFYSPEEEDGLFVFEFETDVKSVGSANLLMGNSDLDAQGKYHKGELPCRIEGNKVLVDARGTLRTLNILFPAVVEDVIDESTEAVGPGAGTYDTEHATIRLSNVIDVNGNYFRAQQAGNLGSFSYYMNYKELMETINFDGDNKMAGEEVVSGESIRLWLGSENVRFDSLLITYLTEVEEDAFEQRCVFVKDFQIEPDPYQGVIISFVMPVMTDVAIGQLVRVTLYEASTTDGMPHDLSIDFKAGAPAAITQVRQDHAPSLPYVWTITGLRVRREALPAGTLFIE